MHLSSVVICCIKVIFLFLSGCLDFWDSVWVVMLGTAVKKWIFLKVVLLVPNLGW